MSRGAAMPRLTLWSAHNSGFMDEADLLACIFSTQSCLRAQNMTFQLATAWFMTSFSLLAYQHLVESWGFHGTAKKNLYHHWLPVTSEHCLILNTLHGLVSRSDKNNHFFWLVHLCITVTLHHTSCQVSNKTLKLVLIQLSWFLNIC